VVSNPKSGKKLRGEDAGIAIDDIRSALSTLSKRGGDSKLVTLVGGRFNGERYRVDSAAYRIDPSDDEGVVTYYRNPDKASEFIVDDPDDARLLPYKVEEYRARMAEKEAEFERLQSRVARLERIVGTGLRDRVNWPADHRTLSDAISHISQSAKSRFFGPGLKRFFCD
jgi:hypothetical protein